MGAETKIEWTDHTFNGWWGCNEVSPACDHCYAAASAHRWGFDIWGKNAPRRFFGDKHWKEPLKWNREAAAERVRKSVFCGSMMDIMERRKDLVEPRKRIYQLITDTPWLDWLLLTKRPGLYRYQLPGKWVLSPPRNVRLGTTVESNKYLGRIEQLKSVPAAIHFLSSEPLIEKLHLTKEHLRGIDWVIVGGESGAKARPMHPDWVREIRDLCVECGVKFFFKQWGNWHPVEDVDFESYDHSVSGEEGYYFGIGQNGKQYFDRENGRKKRIHSWEDGSDSFSIYLTNKHESGRLLDGKTWDEKPVGVEVEK